MGSYISGNGLPYAVASSSSLPAGAYVGHVCLNEDTGALMVNTSSGYVATPTTDDLSIAPSYATTSAFPATHKAGRIVFCEADKSLYLDNGTAYKKITSAT